MKFSKLKTLTVVLAATTTLTFSAPSQALVAIAMWNPILMGVGLAATSGSIILATGAGGIVEIAEEKARHAKHPIGWKVLEYVGYGLAGVLVLAGMGGMILLDGENAGTISFTEIDKEMANKLNITEAERVAYNLEIDQVNMIASEVQSELAKKTQPTIEDAKNEWEKVKGIVSPNTITALTKVLAQFQK